MFIAFVLVLLFILMGVLASTYSVFSPFTQNIGDVVDFNSAYYGAIASIERANLVLKYKQPGFEGSGGYFGTNNFGPVSDYITGDFGTISTGSNGISWKISSRTMTIPSSGDGNVDALLASSDSSNFNQLPYFSTEKLTLAYDKSPSDRHAYTGTNITTDLTYFKGGAFSGQFRLPPKVKTAFSDAGLCWSNTTGCDLDADNTYDDVAINWKLKGTYSGILFSIVPNSDVNVTTGYNQVVANKDTMFRESVVDHVDSGAVFFGSTTNHYQYNPILKNTNNNLSGHNIISSDPTDIKPITYNALLNNTQTTDLEFSFGIVNLLYSTNNNIYPFLEYKLSFGAPIANRFYTIEGKSLVGNYNVRIIMKKSTNTDSPIGDFTVVF